LIGESFARIDRQPRAGRYWRCQRSVANGVHRLLLGWRRRRQVGGIEQLAGADEDVAVDAIGEIDLDLRSGGHRLRLARRIGPRREQHRCGISAGR
jgi:hypothetical protein